MYGYPHAVSIFKLLKYQNIMPELHVCHCSQITSQMPLILYKPYSRDLGKPMFSSFLHYCDCRIQFMLKFYIAGWKLTVEMEKCNEQSFMDLLPIKRKKSTDWHKCLVCQGDKKEKLRQASDTGITTFLSAVQYRQDTVHERLQPDIDLGNLEVQSILWHGSCYASYTSPQNLTHSQKELLVEHAENIPPSNVPLDMPFTRSASEKLNWKLCLFCQKRSYRKNTSTCKVSSMDFQEKILDAAIKEH